MTNKTITFNSLDGAFLNTGNMTLNIGYLKELIQIRIDTDMPNVKADRERLYNNRVPAHSIVWEAFMREANRQIENNYSDRYTATSNQLKAYLKSYGFDYKECFSDLVELVKTMRANRED